MDRIVVLIIVWFFLVAVLVTTVFSYITLGITGIYRSQNATLLLSVLVFILSSVATTLLLVFYHSHGSRPHIHDSSLFDRLQLCTTVLYLSSLWLLKISVLISYFSEFTHHMLLKRAWYSVTGMTIITYACCVVNYPCSKSVFNKEDFLVQISIKSLWFTMAWDTISNIFLATFPMVLIFQTKASKHLEMAAAVRSAAISIVIWISIVRTAGSHAYYDLDKVFWLDVWGVIQNATFIVVCNTIAIWEMRNMVNDSITHNSPHPISLASGYLGSPRDRIDTLELSIEGSSFNRTRDPGFYDPMLSTIEGEGRLISTFSLDTEST